MSSGKPVNIKIGKTENTMDIEVCVFEDEVPVNFGAYDSSNSYCGSKVPIKVMGRIDYEEQEMSIRWDEVGNSEAIKLFTDIHADVYNDRKFFMRYEVGEFTLLIQEFLLLGYGDSFKDEDVDKTVLAIIPVSEPIELDSRGEPMIWEWETTIVDEDMEIPTVSGNTYGFYIDWGDGSTENYAGDGSVNPSHVYSVAGKYTVEVRGQCPQLVFEGTDEASKVRRILGLGETGLISCEDMFYGVNPSEVVFSDKDDMSSVTNVLQMMRGFTTMEIPPNMNSWDLSSATTLSFLMSEWKGIVNPPLVGDIDISHMTSLYYAMYQLNSITSPPNLTTWDTSNVANMGHMMSGWGNCTVGDSMGLHLWNIGSLVTADWFAYGTTIATATMDKILFNWNAQPHKNNVTIDFGTGTYTDTASYDALVADGWVISGITLA